MGKQNESNWIPFPIFKARYPFLVGIIHEARKVEIYRAFSGGASLRTLPTDHSQGRSGKTEEFWGMEIPPSGQMPEAGGMRCTESARVATTLR